MALTGMLPVVHSFACFLSTRPNEQIYNNATERTKIIYVGSLAGLLPSGPAIRTSAFATSRRWAAFPTWSWSSPPSEAQVAQTPGLLSRPTTSQ